MNLTIKEIAWHRNGISGEGFYAVNFIDHEQKGDGNKDAHFLGIVFDTPGQCAVIQLNQSGEFTIQFGHNSWRGDHYEDDLRKAIAEKSTNRVGPFSL